ncbi:hypothetical protein DENSPDRAFT_885627 [Dentipellis sp. KUC8613]|nr:hypothetical protein DENSPDRAFT_885627 [Dentipellis sp. KUC8613]
MLSLFEPKSVIAQLKVLQPRTKQARFAADWKARVESHKKKWMGRRKTQSQVAPQLEWAAHVVEYVDHVWKLTEMGKVALKPDVLLYGPRFVPPSYLH